jgi:hypothetical protein
VRFLSLSLHSRASRILTLSFIRPFFIRFLFQSKNKTDWEFTSTSNTSDSHFPIMEAELGQIILYRFSSLIKPTTSVSEERYVCSIMQCSTCTLIWNMSFRSKDSSLVLEGHPPLTYLILILEGRVTILNKVYPVQSGSRVTFIDLPSFNCTAPDCP